MLELVFQSIVPRLQQRRSTYFVHMSWLWKTDKGWKEYSKEDIEAIEDQFKKGKKRFDLNATYAIDFKNMIQVRKDDPTRQRNIKREGPAVEPRAQDEDPRPAKKGKQTKTEKVAEELRVNPKRLQRDFKITKDAEAKGVAPFTCELIDEDLYQWEIKLREFDPSSELYKEMSKYEKKHGIDHVTIRLYFPGDYPLEAPFVHIVSPKLVGGFVSVEPTTLTDDQQIFSGGMCASVLMQGWSAGIVPESLILQIRTLLHEGNPRIYNMNKIESWSENEARSGFQSAKQAHANDKSFE
ncbi:ubiquitin-conjugating enzyme E2 Q2-like [Planoprotostelium fungivorum]|uniref:Ubiquitin-conjugating enzyme E2 Q2-like n=1 Tax=Planoprotostelium fungivorum TaxID=1890364 RepID=A0A2P6N3S6_9EUKA|nr:ubiquitin-conjugating enzyme E2 Q2-like [Planoprotostelium fungivorum]